MPASWRLFLVSFPLLPNHQGYCIHILYIYIYILLLLLCICIWGLYKITLPGDSPIAGQSRSRSHRFQSRRLVTAAASVRFSLSYLKRWPSSIHTWKLEGNERETLLQDVFHPQASPQCHLATSCRDTPVFLGSQFGDNGHGSFCQGASLC